jgi:sulfonate transport system permease protein
MSPASVIKRRPGAAERNPAAYARRNAIVVTTLAILVPIVLLALWQFQPWISNTLLPTPTTVLRYVDDAFGNKPGGHMWTDVVASIRRIWWGYFWGCGFGLGFGYWLGLSRTARKSLDPTLILLYTVPKLSLIAVFLIVLGFDDTPLILTIAITVFFFVYLQTSAAVRGVGESYREAGLSLGAGRWQRFRHIIFPASLPQVFVGLRISAGVAVLTVIGSEFAYAPRNEGLGYRINLARTLVNPPPMYIAIVLTSIIGIIFTWIVTFIGRRLTRWAAHADGESVL